MEGSSQTTQGDMERIIRPWHPAPQRNYIFTNANLIDPVTGTVHKNTTVQLSDGLVSSVGPIPSYPQDGTRNHTVQTHLNGKYICPGLIDCHVHIAAVPKSASLRELKDLSPSKGLLRQPIVCQSMLDRGFTTVRDCGGATLALKESIQDGVIAGPRLFIAGHALSQRNCITVVLL